MPVSLPSRYKQIAKQKTPSSFWFSFPIPNTDELHIKKFQKKAFPAAKPEPLPFLPPQSITRFQPK